jgi:hypothetical protein
MGVFDELSFWSGDRQAAEVVSSSFADDPFPSGRDISFYSLPPGLL